MQPKPSAYRARRTVRIGGRLIRNRATEIFPEVPLSSEGGRLHLFFATPGSEPYTCQTMFCSQCKAEYRVGFTRCSEDRKSTRLNSSSRLHLVCRLLLEKKKEQQDHYHLCKHALGSQHSVDPLGTQ